MDSFPQNLMYKCIILDDARSIVQHSFIVHNSVNHLDLSTCEYTSYQKQIQNTLNCSSSRVSKSYIQTEEDSRKFFIKERHLLYVFHLDLPKDKEPRLRSSPFFSCLRNSPFYKEAECDSKTFHVSGIIVKDIWYKRNVQDFLIPFLRLADRKVDSLKKVFDARLSYGAYSLLFGPTFSFCVVSNIFCCEIEESDNLRGVLIAVNNHNAFTIANEADVLLYQNYSKENGLQKNTHFDMDIINRLLHMMEYHFLPTALIYGHAPQFLRYNLEDLQRSVGSYPNHSEEQLIKGVLEGVLSVRRNALLLLNLLPLLQSEGHEAVRQTASHVLSIMWLAIPDPFLSRKEVEYAFKEVLQQDLFNLFNNFYEETVEEYPLHPTPRSLKHYSRMVVRTYLKDSGFLPKGIRYLGLPQKLQSYLRLGF